MVVEYSQLLGASVQLFSQRNFAAAEQAVMRAQALLEVIMLQHPDDNEAADINAVRRMLERQLQACQQGLQKQQSFQVTCILCPQLCSWCASAVMLYIVATTDVDCVSW